MIASLQGFQNPSGLCHAKSLVIGETSDRADGFGGADLLSYRRQPSWSRAYKRFKTRQVYALKSLEESSEKHPKDLTGLSVRVKLRSYVNHLIKKKYLSKKPKREGHAKSLEESSEKHRKELTGLSVRVKLRSYVNHLIKKNAYLKKQSGLGHAKSLDKTSKRHRKELTGLSVRVKLRSNANHLIKKKYLSKKTVRS